MLYQESTIARRASANAYLKTVIQALQDYALTIWAGRNDEFHAKTQDTELIVHAQLKLKFDDSILQTQRIIC